MPEFRVETVYPVWTEFPAKEVTTPDRKMPFPATLEYLALRE